MNPLKRLSPLATAIFAGVLTAGAALAEPVIYERVMYKPEQQKSDPISLALIAAGVVLLARDQRRMQDSMDTFYIRGGRIVPGYEIGKPGPK